MANKKFLWAMLAGLLALSMAFSACENGTQEVEGNVGITSINDNKAPQVSRVTAVKTSNNQYYIVSWDAIAEDVEYKLYFQQADKKSSSEMYSVQAQNQYSYNSTTGESIPNTDLDKWSCRVNNLPALTPGSYHLGVRTKFTNSGITGILSDIKWADATINVTAGPQVTSVTAIKFGNSINVSWPSVSATSTYRVSLWNVVYDYEERSDTTGVGATDHTFSSIYSGTYRVSVRVIPTTTDITVLSPSPVWSTNTVTFP